jgi:hypothetical protein
MPAPNIPVACDGIGSAELDSGTSIRGAQNGGAGNIASLADLRGRAVRVIAGTDGTPPTMTGSTEGTQVVVLRLERPDRGPRPDGARQAVSIQERDHQAHGAGKHPGEPQTVPGAAPAHCLAQSADAWTAFSIMAGTGPDELAGTEFLIDPNGYTRAIWRPDGTAAWRGADMLDTLLRTICTDPISPPSGGYHENHH